jgi:hypothetical protein
MPSPLPVIIIRVFCGIHHTNLQKVNGSLFRYNLSTRSSGGYRCVADDGTGSRSQL